MGEEDERWGGGEQERGRRRRRRGGGEERGKYVNDYFNSVWINPRNMYKQTKFPYTVHACVCLTMSQTKLASQ